MIRAGLLLLLLLVIGCGPTPQQVASEYQAPMDQLRQKLARLAEKMPPGVGDQAVSAALDPPLLLVDDDANSNAQAMMFEHLSDAAANLDLDLLIDNELKPCLRWTSDLPPGSTGDVNFMRKSFEQATRARYLVVHRTLSYVPAKARDEENFTPARARVQGVVFDLETEAVLATYVVQAMSAEKVEYVYREGESRAEGIERFADSSVWSATRAAAAEKLANVTGGSVQFDTNERKHVGTAITTSSLPKIVVPPTITTLPPVPVAPPLRQSPPPAAPEEVVRVAPQVPQVDMQRQQLLRELTPTSAEVLVENEHKLLRDFTVGGTKFANGFYAHPPEAKQPARIVFALNKKYTRLTGSAGQGDGFPPNSFTALTFRIRGDGRDLWTSSPIKQHGQWEEYSVDLTDVEELELLVDCPGPHSFAWGVWMDPVLTRREN